MAYNRSSYQYKNPGYFLRVTPELHTWIRHTKIDVPKLCRLLLRSLQNKDEKIITQLCSLMEVEKDDVTRFCKQEQYTKAELFQPQSQGADTLGTSLSDIMKQTNSVQH